VKTSILPVDIIKKFKILLSRRTDVDYGDFDTIDAKDSEDSLRDAEVIIETIDKVRKRLMNELET
jgi:hypothetical protein